MAPNSRGSSPPADAQAKDNMRRALQAIGLIVVVVLFNLGLYVGIVLLTRNSIITGGSSFPALVLFLSFALSLGIILIVALGEKVDTKNVENEWIKKIGVTPIMVIVAVIIAIFASFSPLAEKVIASDPSLKPKFMLANLGITCLTSERNNSPQASHLLIVTSSQDEGYIKDVKKFLNDKKLMERHAKNPNLEFVVRKIDDEFYKLLNDYAHSDQKGSESLLDDMSKEDRWVAYRVDVLDPTLTTSVPVPTAYDKTHKTRLLVITKQRPTSRQPELASLVASVGAGPTLYEKVLPLFQVEIAPKRMEEDWHQTNLDFKVFADHICWHVGSLTQWRH